MSKYLKHSFLQLYKACQYRMLKSSPTPWCYHLQTGVFRVMCSAICPPNMVCIMASKEFHFALIWPDYILPVFHRLGLESTLCFYPSWDLVWHLGNVTPFYRPSPQVVVGSWTTLIINVTPLPEILWGAPGRCQFMVKLGSFHFRIMAPTVLTGTFRSLEMHP